MTLQFLRRLSFFTPRKSAHECATSCAGLTRARAALPSILRCDANLRTPPLPHLNVHPSISVWRRTVHTAPSLRVEHLKDDLLTPRILSDKDLVNAAQTALNSGSDVRREICQLITTYEQQQNDAVANVES